MYQVIIVIHVLLGLGIIGLIMMQQGKGADAGASFGSGSAGSVFGAQGAASFLSRTTAILATLFFITSLGLAFLGGKKGQSTDLMAPTAAQEEQLSIPVTPDVATQKMENLIVDQLKTQIPAAPAASDVKGSQAIPEKAVTATEAPADIQPTVVPKADEIKTVEEKTAVPEKAKEPAKK
ncbi:hypothetical protein JCM14076_13640 [Methylosoma difficile]